MRSFAEPPPGEVDVDVFQARLGQVDVVQVGPAVAHGVEHAVEEAVGRVHEEAQPLEPVPLPLRAGLDRLDRHPLERFGKARHLGRAVELGAEAERARPGEDRGDRIGRGFLAGLASL